MQAKIDEQASLGHPGWGNRWKQIIQRAAVLSHSRSGGNPA